MTYQILSDILVQLDLVTPPEEGIYVPKFDTFSSEDGRQRTRVSDNIYDTKGTVLQVASESLLQPGDRVIVSSPSSHKYFFNPENSTHFTGLIKIPQTLIDAKIIQ